MSIKDDWFKLLNDLNAIKEGVYFIDSKMGAWNNIKYHIVRYHGNKMDFVKIHFAGLEYLQIKTSEYGINFKGRGNFETKNIAKKLHKKCNELMLKLDNENAYKI